MAKYGFTGCQVNKNRVTSSTMHTSLALLWVKSCIRCIYICAVTPEMNLLPSVGSDKAWVYSVNADFADEEPKVEQLAIRFKNAESEFRCNLLPVSFAKYSTSKKKTLKFKLYHPPLVDANKFKAEFIKSQEQFSSASIKNKLEGEKLADDLEKLKVNEESESSPKDAETPPASAETAQGSKEDDQKTAPTEGDTPDKKTSEADDPPNEDS